MKVKSGCKQLAREVTMATDSMYLENLEEYVNDEGKIVCSLNNSYWFSYSLLYYDLHMLFTIAS